MAANTAHFAKNGLTGGTSGKLDAIDDGDITADDIAFAIDSDSIRMYEARVSASAESSPDIIAPDSGGSFRWILLSAADGNTTPRMIVRPHFEMSATGTDYIKISGGIWYIDGIGVVYNNTTIDYQMTSLATDDWTYLYIDYSTLTGAGVITGSNLIDATTEWAADYADNGHFNGDDRGIFAVYGTGASSYSDFWQSRDRIAYNTKTLLSASTSSSYQTITPISPVGSRTASVRMDRNGAGTTTISLDGTSIWGYLISDAQQIFSWLVTNEDGQFYTKTNVNSYDIYQNGFVLPFGL